MQDTSERARFCICVIINLKILVEGVRCVRVNMLRARALMCDVCRLCVCVCVDMRHYAPKCMRRVFVYVHARKPVAWNMLEVGFTVCVRRLRECGACAWTAWMLFVVCTTWERACVRNRNKLSSVLPEPTGKKVEKVDQRGDRTLDRSIQNTTFTH